MPWKTFAVDDQQTYAPWLAYIKNKPKTEGEATTERAGEGSSGEDINSLIALDPRVCNRHQ